VRIFHLCDRELGTIAEGQPREVGVDNVMFSIDYPFKSTERAVQFIRTAPLAPADQARVAHMNAERILRLSEGNP
jgi:2,3-dihydroxybenzoate decarboxylase